MRFFLIIIIFSLNLFSQEKKDTSINLWEGDVKIELLDEIVFIPISKKQIKDIVKKISNSLDRNYKKDDFLFMNYEEKIIANDTVENNITGKFGVIVPNYQNINIQDIEIAKIFELKEKKIAGVEQTINAFSAPFLVPTMGFILPIISIRDAPFIDGISDYKYSGWEDQDFYIIQFDPEDYKDAYKFCGKIVINKQDFSIVNINYELCTKENIMKVKDLPYVSNKLSYTQKIKLQTALLFMGSVRKFSNNLYCNTFNWSTDIGYRKDSLSGKYTLDYLFINSSSIVKGKMEENLLEKINNNKVRKSLENKKYIDVTQKYKLSLTTSKDFFIPEKKELYLNALYYRFIEGNRNQEKTERKGGIRNYDEKIMKFNKIYEKLINSN